MRTTIHELVHDLLRAPGLDGPVVEFGARRIEGQGRLAPVRELVGDRPYVGSDLERDAGIDLVQDVERIALADGTIATALVLETLEHVARPWRALSELRRCLRPDGVIVVTTVFFFPIHAYPSDYWRFTDQALEVLLEDFDRVDARSIGLRLLPHSTVALAGGPEVTDDRWRDLTEVLDRWTTRGATSWKETALATVPPAVLGAGYTGFQRLSSALGRSDAR